MYVRELKSTTVYRPSSTPYMKIKQQRQISHNANYIFKTVPRSAHEAAPARRIRYIVGNRGVCLCGIV